MQTTSKCPICGQTLELIPDPEDATRLLGFCGHTPGGFPQRVIDIPATVSTPQEPDKKNKGVK
jgi:hypothetical protein